MSTLVSQANDAILAFQDFDASYDRQSVEFRQIETQSLERLKSIIHQNAESTLEEVLTLIKQVSEVRDRLDDLRKKRSLARNDAKVARNKALHAWTTEAGLLDVERPKQPYDAVQQYLKSNDDTMDQMEWGGKGIPFSGVGPDEL
jgi:hypothetical protein